MRLFCVFLTTCTTLMALDLAVAIALRLSDNSNTLPSLVSFFEYGRSVPGKLHTWEVHPNLPGNLYDVAWLDKSLVLSTEKFEAQSYIERPTVRSYGMSFVNRILMEASRLDPDLSLDNHSGPGAPPNYTFAAFQQDRLNRREGDVVIFGILSSSIVGMAALSNRTWVFEQPAPFTYPIYHPVGASPNLVRTEPIIRSAAENRALRHMGQAQIAWRTQLMNVDNLWTPAAFDLHFLDISPFARLVRRSLAISAIEARKAAVLAGDYPYEEVLRRMIVAFAQETRADQQKPVVFLIQSQNPRDPDLIEMVTPVLEAHAIPYLATANIIAPTDQSSFLTDGHYKPEIDQIFALEFLQILAQK